MILQNKKATHTDAILFVWNLGYTEIIFKMKARIVQP